MLTVTCAIVVIEYGNVCNACRKCLLFFGLLTGIEASRVLSPIAAKELNDYSSTHNMPLFEIADNVVGLIGFSLLCLVILLGLSLMASHVAFKQWQIKCMHEMAAWSFAFSPILATSSVLVATAN